MHPVYVAAQFVSDATKPAANIRATYSIRGLAKLLAFGHVAKNAAESRNTTMRAIVEEELERFPYTRKAAFKEPYFSPTDLRVSTSVSYVHELNIFY